MLLKNFRNPLLVLVAAAACVSTLAPSAAACDRDKLARLASGGSLAANATNSAGYSPSAGAGLQGPSNSIVGLWHVKDYAGDQLVDETFDTWHADGNELFIDATNPAFDNVCQGIWKQVSATTMKLKHISWIFDDNGNVSGTAVFHDWVTLSADGNSFNGTENVYVYDLDGNLIGEYDGDVLQATRITVDF